MRRAIVPYLTGLYLALAQSSAAQEAPRLSLPLQCEPGKTCFIQHYVDIDEGPGVRDFRCGTATYEGHKGVDFRLLSAAAAKAGVPVVAAAPGVVKGLRDGMADAFVRETGKASVADRECGNGMVIDHGNGWETQYCHLRQGSVVVKRGQRVERGEKLGEVGWSGLADFAHLHLSVRKDAQPIEPFTGRGQENACTPHATDSGLWDDTVTGAFPYANGQFLGAGFVEAVPGRAALEHDHRDVRPVTASSPLLAIYARIANVREGDQVRFIADGPGGFTIRGLDSLKAANQVQISAAGKRRSGNSPWPQGRYKGRVELIRDGVVLSSQAVQLDLR
jgi:hypothetical protein